MSTADNLKCDELDAFNVWCSDLLVGENKWTEMNSSNKIEPPTQEEFGDTWDIVPSTSTAKLSEAVPISDPTFELLVNKGDLFENCVHYVVPVKCSCPCQVEELVCRKCLRLFCGALCLQNNIRNGCLSPAVKTKLRSSSLDGRSREKQIHTVTNDASVKCDNESSSQSKSESLSFIQREKFTKVGDVFEQRYQHPNSERKVKREEKSQAQSNCTENDLSKVPMKSDGKSRTALYERNVVPAIDNKETRKVLRDQQYSNEVSRYALTAEKFLTIDDPMSRSANEPGIENNANTIIGKERGSPTANATSKMPKPKLTRGPLEDNPINHAFRPPAMTVFEMGCLYVETPHLISLATQEACKRNLNLMKDIKNIHPKIKVTDVYEGDYVLTAYDDNETLYRAKILQVYNDKVEVYYVDFGNTEKRKIEDLFELPKSLLAIQPVVIHFKICNVEQPESQRWSANAIRFLNKLCFENTVRCLVQYVSETPAGPLYAGVLKINAGDRWVDVGERLIFNKFAKRCTPNLISSFVQDDCQLRIQVYPEISLQDSNAKPPELKLNQEIEGEICHIAGSQNFHIVLAHEKPDKESLMRELNNEMKNPELCHSYEPENGPMCSVFVYDQWWRARVLLIKKDQSVEVLLIDEGTYINEGLQLYDLKRLPDELKRRKCYAYRCQLTILPKDSTTWSHELIEKLKKKKKQSSHSIRATCFHMEKGIHTVELFPPNERDSSESPHSISTVDNGHSENVIDVVNPLNLLENNRAPEVPDISELQLHSFILTPTQEKENVELVDELKDSELNLQSCIPDKENENIDVAERMDDSKSTVETSEMVHDSRIKNIEVTERLKTPEQDSHDLAVKENDKVVDAFNVEELTVQSGTKENEYIQPFDPNSDPESFKSCTETSLPGGADTSNKDTLSSLEISSASSNSCTPDECDAALETSSESVTLKNTPSKFTMEHLPKLELLSTLMTRNEKFYVFLTNVWGIVYIVPQFNQRKEINECLKDYMAKHKDTCVTDTDDFVPQKDDIVVIKLNRKLVRALINNISGTDAHLRLLDRGDDVTISVTKLIPANTEIMMFPPLGYLVKLTGVSDEMKLLFSKIKDLNTNLKSHLYVLDSVLGPYPLEPSIQMASLKIADDSNCSLSSVITTLGKMNWELYFDQDCHTSAEITAKGQWSVKTEEEFFNLEEDINLHKQLASTVLRTFIFEKDLMIVLMKPDSKALLGDIDIIHRKMQLYYSKIPGSTSSKKKPKGPFVAVRVADQTEVIKNVFNTTWHRCTRSGNKILALDHQTEWQLNNDGKIVEIREICPEFLEIQSACFLAKYPGIDFSIDANSQAVEQVFSPGCESKFVLTEVDKANSEKPIYTMKCPAFEKLKVVNETEANPFKEPHQDEEFWK